MIRLLKYSEDFEAETLCRIAEFFGFHQTLIKEITEEERKKVSSEAAETLQDWQRGDNELYVILQNEETVGFPCGLGFLVISATSGCKPQPTYPTPFDLSTNPTRKEMQKPWGSLSPHRPGAAIWPSRHRRLSLPSDRKQPFAPWGGAGFQAPGLCPDPCS